MAKSKDTQINQNEAFAALTTGWLRLVGSFKL